MLSTSGTGCKLNPRERPILLAGDNIRHSGSKGETSKKQCALENALRRLDRIESSPVGRKIAVRKLAIWTFINDIQYIPPIHMDAVGSALQPPAVGSSVVVSGKGC